MRDLGGVAVCDKGMVLMRKPLFIPFLLLLCLGAAGAAGEMPDMIQADVTWVIDGSTLEVQLGVSRDQARLAGIAIPAAVALADKQMKSPARAAWEYTRSLIEGKQIWLDFGRSRRRDADGRILVHAWLAKPLSLDKEEFTRKSLEALLLLQGCAKISPDLQDQAYAAPLLLCEQEAKQAGLGIWAEASSPAGGVEIIVYISKTGTKYHRQDCITLKSAGTPIALAAAKARGYTPCSKCKPPE